MDIHYSIRTWSGSCVSESPHFSGAAHGTARLPAWLWRAVEVLVHDCRWTWMHGWYWKGIRSIRLSCCCCCQHLTDSFPGPKGISHSTGGSERGVGESDCGGMCPVNRMIRSRLCTVQAMLSIGPLPGSPARTTLPGSAAAAEAGVELDDNPQRWRMDTYSVHAISLRTLPYQTDRPTRSGGQFVKPFLDGLASDRTRYICACVRGMSLVCTSGWSG